MQRIDGVSQLLGEGSRRWRVHLGRAFAVQRLMRPLVVALLAKSVEAFLLLQRMLSCRSRGFGLQCPMHPLVLAVLLRVPRIDAFVHNPQSHPPHGQPREPVQPLRRKRRSIVRPYEQRQPAAINSARYTVLGVPPGSASRAGETSVVRTREA